MRICTGDDRQASARLAMKSAFNLRLKVLHIIGRVYYAASNLVSRIVDLDILHEMTGYKRNRRFLYRHYLRLFHDDQGVNTGINDSAA